ncbi:phage tail protein [Burkholderia ambifaria]|uniref:phage tail protein n=1 Tax=Burkholderia ambifaria TaxID=152480 RepID=UPI00158E6F16|nr:phage tail protein [Burkholderia ambifaria]
MLIHQYSSDTGEYISSKLPDINPRNPTEWLIPAFCTSDPLPERLPKTWPFRRGDAWVMLPDYRGVVLYRQDTGEPAELVAAGVTPEEKGLAETPRPSPDHVWRDGEWQVDEARVALRLRRDAMAEFEARLGRAQQMNMGKADAYSAKLLSLEDAYYFRAWTAQQLELTRVIRSPDFPRQIAWPADPQPFEIACRDAIAEFEARAAQAQAFLDALLKDRDRASFTPTELQNCRAFELYLEAIKAAIYNGIGNATIEWPQEPAILPDPPTDATPPDAAS